jgi:hypothetical protein
MHVRLAQIVKTSFACSLTAKDVVGNPSWARSRLLPGLNLARLGFFSSNGLNNYKSYGGVTVCRYSYLAITDICLKY